LEYERYLKEVVEALESDPEFRKKNWIKHLKLILGMEK